MGDVLEAPSGLLPCLIVSSSQKHAHWLRSAAGEAGWSAVVRDDVAGAIEATVRWRFRLAIVDLSRTRRGEGQGIRDLAERLSRDRELLLIVCGTGGDPTEEIWAHQLGTWLYVAGLDSGDGISAWCAGAREVVEKLFPPAGQPAKRAVRASDVTSLTVDI
jgi:hypothetical protein